MSDEIFDKLISFVLEQSAVDDEEITRNTQLEDHLGVTGDDAVDFLIAYSKAFNVDVTNFMAADYFNAEGDTIFLCLKNIIGNAERQKKILTVGHLEKGIVAGKLDDDIINS